jgi:ribose transport system substrate-binding protein
MRKGSFMQKSSRSHLPGAVGVVAAVAVFAAACGSSSGSGSSGSGSSSSSADAAAAQKAYAAVKAEFKSPASIGVTTPLSKTPPKNLTVDVVTNTLTVGLLLGSAAVDAGKLLGWNVKVLTMNSTPEGVLSVLQQAINQKPTAIIINGQPRSEIKSVFASATANHVALVDVQGDLTGGPTGPLVADLYEAKQFATLATHTANWAIWNSGGKADALLVAYANYPLSKYITNTTAQVINSKCPNCKTTKLLVQASATGTTLPASIVSALQRNPSIDYVILQDGAMALGVDAALRGADLLGKVKVMGNDETPQTAASTLSGAELGWQAFSQTAVAWGAMDAVARHVVGDAPPDPPLMTEIFTKANLTAHPSQAVWNDLPTDLAAQYAKLWHVSS